MTKAQKYIQDRKPDIEISLDEDGRLHELENLLISLNETIELLKPLRLNDNATTLKLNEIFNTKRNILFTSWLIKALSYDKSFMYAYNYLAQKRNRENGSVVYPVIIPVDYNEIESLVSNDKRKNKNNSKQKTFNCNLKEPQFGILTQHINQIKLFEIEINTKDLNDIINCNLTSPLKILNVKLLVYLFDALDNNKMVSPEWQDVIGHYKLFISKRGTVISRENLYSQRSQMLKDYAAPPRGAKIVDQAIKEIKKLKTI